MTATASPSPSPSTPPPSPPPPVLVIASLVLDVAALVAIVILAKWNLLPREVVTGLLSTLIAGRIVAKSVRGGGPPGSGGSGWGAGVSAIGGVVAVLGAMYGLGHLGTRARAPLAPAPAAGA